MGPSRDAPRPPNQPDTPDVQQLLYAIQDDYCRTVIRLLAEPMTANEIATAMETPLSTTYRKLDRLCDASLVEQTTDIRAAGQHVTKFQLSFETVKLRLDVDEQHVDMSVTPAAGASSG